MSPTTHDILLTPSHDLLLTTHDPLLTTHYSRPTSHYSPPTTNYALPTHSSFPCYNSFRSFPSISKSILGRPQTFSFYLIKCWFFSKIASLIHPFDFGIHTAKITWLIWELKHSNSNVRHFRLTSKVSPLAGTYILYVLLLYSCHILNYIPVSFLIYFWYHFIHPILYPIVTIRMVQVLRFEQEIFIA